MSTIELPKTVRESWGPEIANDFTAWLSAQLQAVKSDPRFQISALMARRKVNTLVLQRVSNLLLADEPTLEQLSTEEWVWRVPVDLTFPVQGRVGRVGEIDVDAQHGEVRYTAALLEKMGHDCEQLAKQMLTSTHE